MKIKAITVILAVLIVLPLYSACGADDETKIIKGGLPEGVTVYDADEKSRYYCPDIFYTTVVPCRVEIKSGKIQYACPVKGCDHKGKDCYFYNKWVKTAFDTGRYMIMIVRSYPSGNYILAYEWKSGRMYEICTADKLNKTFIPGTVTDTVYAYYHTSSTGGTYTRVYEYNVFTGDLFTRSVYGDLRFLYCENGTLYGMDTNGAIMLIPGGEEIAPCRMPEGCNGFELRKPGMLYKTDAPAAVYDIKSGVTVYPDPSLDVTSPVYSGGGFYYQSRGGVVTGRKANGEEVKYVRYDNVIYRQSLDGKTEKFVIDTDYHFIIYAADGDFAVGRLMYKLSDGIYTPFEELDHDHIRINLKTGEVQTLDLYTEHDYFL